MIKILFFIISERALEYKIYENVRNDSYKYMK